MLKSHRSKTRDGHNTYVIMKTMCTPSSFYIRTCRHSYIAAYRKRESYSFSPSFLVFWKAEYYVVQYTGLVIWIKTFLTNIHYFDTNQRNIFSFTWKRTITSYWNLQSFTKYLRLTSFHVEIAHDGKILTSFFQELFAKIFLFWQEDWALTYYFMKFWDFPDFS